MKNKSFFPLILSVGVILILVVLVIFLFRRNNQDIRTINNETEITTIIDESAGTEEIIENSIKEIEDAIDSFDVQEDLGDFEDPTF